MSLSESELIGLTNREVEAYLRRMELQQFFAGCFAVDEVPTEELSRMKKFALVVNLSISSQAGSHFVVLQADNENCLNYFDSLAINPAHLHSVAKNMLNGLGRSEICIQLPIRVQSVISAYCGVYSIFFVMLTDSERFPNQSGLESFATASSSDRLSNDGKCLRNIQRLLTQNT